MAGLICMAGLIYMAGIKLHVHCTLMLYYAVIIPSWQAGRAGWQAGRLGRLTCPAII